MMGYLIVGEICSTRFSQHPWLLGDQLMWSYDQDKFNINIKGDK